MLSVDPALKVEKPTLAPAVGNQPSPQSSTIIYPITPDALQRNLDYEIHNSLPSN